MYCPDCGTEVPETANFCDSCGTELSGPAGTERPGEQRGTDQGPPPERGDSGHPPDRPVGDGQERSAGSSNDERRPESTEYRDDPVPSSTEAEISQRVSEKTNDGRNPRLVGLGYLALGVVLLGAAYWAGIIGHTEMRGFTRVKVTYPIAALFLGGFGSLSALAGLMGLAGVDITED